MNIVWISPECPYPADTGGKIGIWKRIENLAQKDNIYLFCINDESGEGHISEMLGYCREVHLYKRQHSIVTIIKSIGLPYPAVSRWNAKMASDITECCKRVEVDYIFVDFPQMIGVIPDSIKRKYKIVLHQHNIEHLAMLSLSEKMGNPFKRVIYMTVSKQMKRYEQKIYLNDDLFMYTFVSCSDKAYFENEYGVSNAYLMPVGADYAFEQQTPHTHILSYIGKMSYPANEEASLWFLKNIWQKIKENCKDAKLYLVGKDPTDRLIDFSSRFDDVYVTGTVESVEEYYEMSQLIIIPLLTGGGVKVKLLEALGHGKIVLTTTKGVEGTEFIENEHIVKRDDPEGFAEACLDILLYPERYEGMRQRAIRKICDTYSWSAITEDFRNYLTSR